MFDEREHFPGRQKPVLPECPFRSDSWALGGFGREKQGKRAVVLSWRRCPHLWGRRPWEGQAGWHPVPGLKRSRYPGAASYVCRTDWKN